jgi:rhamnosyltransferase
VKKIAALIITYNPNVNILLRLIERLKTTSFDLGIYVVDNASHNSEQFKNNGDVNFTFLSSNIGLAAAQNHGLKNIINQNYDGVLFFDQDSEPTIDFINSLVQAAIELEDKGLTVGGVGPVFYDSRTNTEYPHEKICGLQIKKIYPQSDESFEVSYLINSGMLVPIRALRNIGMMRGEFFIDYVDIEWCLRGADKGYSFYAVPKARMAHMIGDERKEALGREVSIHSPIRRYYLARNSILMLRLPYVPIGYKMREVIFSFLRTLLFISCVENKKEYIRYIFKGWKDGINGRSGKYIN